MMGAIRLRFRRRKLGGVIGTKNRPEIVRLWRRQAYLLAAEPQNYRRGADHSAASSGGGGAEVSAPESQGCDAARASARAAETLAG